MADTTVAQFVEITGASPEIAAQYLQLADSNIESAMQLYFENGGNPIQPTADSSAPQSSTRPGQSTGYQDEDGVIHLDSEDENNGGVPVGQEGAAQAAGNTFDADLEMARRLQEEFYTGGDPTDNVRAPIERRTETLVGPGLDNGFQPDIMEHLHSRAARRGRLTPWRLLIRGCG